LRNRCIFVVFSVWNAVIYFAAICTVLLFNYDHMIAISFDGCAAPEVYLCVHRSCLCIMQVSKFFQCCQPLLSTVNVDPLFDLQFETVRRDMFPVTTLIIFYTLHDDWARTSLYTICDSLKHPLDSNTCVAQPTLWNSYSILSQNLIFRKHPLTGDKGYDLHLNNNRPIPNWNPFCCKKINIRGTRKTLQCYARTLTLLILQAGVELSDTSADAVKP